MRMAWHAGVLMGLMLGPGSVAAAQWRLWESPDATVNTLSQAQASHTSERGMFAAAARPPLHGVGQSFTAAHDRLYRIELKLKNLSDYRPITIKLWRWVDADRDGRAEDGEYQATVGRSPLWQDTISPVNETEDFFYVQVFPRLPTVPGALYYFELSNATRDHRFRLAVADGTAEDPYPRGALRSNNRFRLPGAAGKAEDLYFRLFAGPGTQRQKPFCGSAAAAVPCFTAPPEHWPRLPPPELGENKTVYRYLIKRLADEKRWVFLDPQRLDPYAERHAAYEAFLYKTTQHPRYVSNAVAMFRKSLAYHRRHGVSPSFDWLQRPAWGYRWMRDAESLTADDHVLIKSLLLASAAAYWAKGVERGPHNRTLIGAVGLKLVTDAVTADEFTRLSRATSNPRYGDLFARPLTHRDHALWVEHAAAQWREFKAAMDFLEDATHYNMLNWQAVLELIELYGEHELWREPRFAALVERFYHYYAPLGTAAVAGDSNGLSQDWARDIYLFEAAGAQLRKPAYRWLAARVMDFRKKHLRAAGMHHDIRDGDLALMRAYLAVDDGLRPEQPAGLVVDTRVAQTDGTRPVSGVRIGQTFTADFSALTRVVCGLATASAQAKQSLAFSVRKWQGDYAATRAAPPLYSQALLIGTHPRHEIDLYVPLERGQRYLILFERATAFDALGSAVDRYPDGAVYLEGKRQAADLQMELSGISGDGSVLTRRRPALAQPRYDGARPADHRHQVFAAAAAVPDKLILRSGFAPQDLHMTVNLTAGTYGHGHQETGAVLSLVGGGAHLLLGSGRNEKARQYKNTVLAQRHWGGVYKAPSSTVQVDALHDYRRASTARISWRNLDGWDSEEGRHIYFIKNRFVWLRDYVRFNAALKATAGTLWHSYDILPPHADNIYSLFSKTSPGVFGWQFKNPEQYVLLYMAPRSGYRMQHDATAFAFDKHEPPTPPSPTYHIMQSWSGATRAGLSKHFDSLLIPYADPAAAQALAGGIRVLHQDAVAGSLVLSVDLDGEHWLLLDNPAQQLVELKGEVSLRTDARYGVVRSADGAVRYLLLESARAMRYARAGRLLLDRTWLSPSSIELGADAR